MTTFTLDQWLILTLAFVLGLVLGMALLASPKWKQRYREEVTRREAVEAECAQLRRDAGEMDSLRQAAARDEARRRDADQPGPL
jgi:outer membrane murein-binding lipoprotein Lpp